MNPLEVLPLQKQEVNREKENCLQFKREAERSQGETLDRMPFVSTGYSPHSEGGLKTVALTPGGAIEQYRRKKKHSVEETAPCSFGRPAAADPAETRDAPGEKNIRETAQKLYRIERLNREIGEGREKIKVGNIIVSDTVPKRPEAAVLGKIFDPRLEKIRIIAGFYIERTLPEISMRQSCNLNDPILNNTGFRFSCPMK